MSGLDLDTNNTRKHQTTNWWSLHHQTTMPTNHLIMDLVFNKVCVFAFRACNYHFLCVSRLHLIYRPLNIFWFPPPPCTCGRVRGVKKWFSLTILCGQIEKKIVKSVGGYDIIFRTLYGSSIMSVECCLVFLVFL